MKKQIVEESVEEFLERRSVELVRDDKSQVDDYLEILKLKREMELLEKEKFLQRLSVVKTILNFTAVIMVMYHEKSTFVLNKALSLGLDMFIKKGD